MKYLSPLQFCLAAACALLPAAAPAADWKFSSSVQYDTGRYGTGSWTDSWYLPFTLKRYYEYADISITLPWLRQSSTGLVTRVGGKPLRTAGEPPAGAAAGTGPPEAGLGDILVHGSYVIKKEGPRSYDLALAGTLKLPTANKNKGLGTGQLDEGLGVEFSKKMTPDLALRADGYYSIIGDPPGADLNNQLSLDIGISRQAGENLVFTALYETSSALLDGNADPRDLNFSLDYKSPDGYHYSGGLLLGLSDGSPNLGLSAGLSRRF